MKKAFVLVVVALLVSAAAPTHAGAWGGHGFHGHGFHGHRFHGHVFIGGPFWGGCCWGGPWWGPGWGWPYYSYAPPVVIRQEPQVYTQQSAPPAQPAPQSQQAYWYYCADSKAYYPYVQQCPAGWLKVVPQTAPPGQ